MEKIQLLRMGLKAKLWYLKMSAVEPPNNQKNLEEVFKNEEQCHLNWIPDELLMNIFSHLDVCSLVRTQKVCHRFKNVAQEKSLWKRFYKYNNPLSLVFGQSIKDAVIDDNRFKNAVATKKLQCIQTLKGHSNSLLSLFYAEKMLFSGSNDATIKVWKLNPQNDQWEYSQTLEDHKNSIFSLFYAEGMLFSGSKDKTIKIWRVNLENSQWECTQTLCEHTNLVNCLYYSKEKLFSGAWDKTIKVWQLNSEKTQWECTQTLEGYSNIYGCGIFCTNGILFSISRNKTIKVWELNIGNNQWECVQTLMGHPKSISSIFYANEMLFSLDWQRTIKVWRRPAHDEQWICTHTFEGHTSFIRNVFYANGMLFSMPWSSKEKIKVLELNTHHNQWECIDVNMDYLTESFLKAMNCIFYINGTLFLGSQDNTIKVCSYPKDQ